MKDFRVRVAVAAVLLCGFIGFVVINERSRALREAARNEADFTREQTEVAHQAKLEFLQDLFESRRESEEFLVQAKQAQQDNAVTLERARQEVAKAENGYESLLPRAKALLASTEAMIIKTDEAVASSERQLEEIDAQITEFQKSSADE
jgi:biopolymer transport protein ExbB/TolQ